MTSATTAAVCSASPTPGAQPDPPKSLPRRGFLAPASSSAPSPVTHTKMQSVASTPVVSAERFRQSVRADFLSTAREGPVTKHIRLTAALILHNLTTFYASIRRRLLRYEPVLCELAFAGTEASPTLTKCLSQCYESLDSEAAGDCGCQASTNDSTVPSAFAGDDLPETLDQASVLSYFLCVHMIHINAFMSFVLLFLYFLMTMMMMIMRYLCDIWEFPSCVGTSG
ncbi:unnamed protein product [Dibothriocephalus latus]|uniref:Uncharacterized protein n=1 Tax=Dibothriocephalus latus TaxID=60516 RepID=A0A3P7LDT8_DIBLA|nr:unnamed protein product [Dibothriocephalus latus]